MPVLYVLSIGPVLRFYVDPAARMDAGEWNTYEKLYGPLIWLSNRSLPVSSALNWYVNLWLPEP